MPFDGANTVTKPPAAPQPFTPSVETIEPDEAETEAELTKTLLEVAETTWKDGGHAIRSVHAKSHGLLKGELKVLHDLPRVLAQGLFARPGTYPVVMRFSTTPGDIIHDKVSTPRGLALKVVGVEGERLPGSEGAVTQDFIMVNKPNFNAANGKALLRGLKLFAATTDHVEGVKKAMSVVLRQVERVIESFGGESAAIEGFGGEQPKHILAQTFYSQLPARYGQYMAKFSVVPVSPELLALEDVRIDVDADYYAIREAIIQHFSTQGGTWELRVQLCTNLKDMPVEDPTKRWSEEESPFFAVAHITALPQPGWSAARSQAVDDGMGFSVWHGLAAHQPLGQLSRMRKIAYASSQRFRTERNPTPVTEPTNLDNFPD